MTSPTPTPTPSEKTTEVIIEAKAALKISYDLGDGTKATVDLRAGDIHTFRTKYVMTLALSDAGAAHVIVNGRERGTPGKSGQPVKLRYPR